MTPNAITTTTTTDRLRGRCQRSRSLTTGDRTKLRRTASVIGISTSRATNRNVAIRAINKTIAMAPPEATGNGTLIAFKTIDARGFLETVANEHVNGAPSLCV